MKFCVECGTKLESRFLENEGIIPYCSQCNQYRFPIFNTAVSMIVMNETENKVLLIKQYGGDSYILVAGYVNKGESAEAAVMREVKEEVGLDVTACLFNKSEYFEKSNTLMLNFVCKVDDECLEGITEEVDQADWFTIEGARAMIKRESLAQRFLENYLG